MLSVAQQSLLGYLPAIIIKNILDGKIELSTKLPQYYSMNTVSLFADISGFTKLSEAFSKKGRIGPEFLAYSLNRYMEQLINIIGKNGGDIFKFAGDAILVIWPENKNIKESCRRAIQCALDIQSKLHNVEITPNKRLSVKVGIGVGECRILVVGGQFRRCEYLSVGEALRQACESETKATDGGQTICSEDVKSYVEGYFEMEETKGSDDHGHGHGEESSMKFYKISKTLGERTKTKADAYLMRTHFNSEKLRAKFSALKTFVPAAISLYLDIEKESWSKEIRMLTIMFLNLKVDLSQTKNEEGMMRIQTIVKSVQRSIYRTRGALNKFLMDDKGSVMLICWGLPPFSAIDDNIRSVQSAVTLVDELKKVNCGAFMGITTGTCFTGVCGTLGNRREYSLLGEVVNLSARYMGKAIKHSIYNKLNDSILVDVKTRDLIQNKIRCEYVASDELKGFIGIYHFYSPVDDSRFIPSVHDPFPFIRTHRNNSIPIVLPPGDKSDPQVFLDKSLFMIGRNTELRNFVKILNCVYKTNRREIIIVRGVLGSGKSLFIRKGMYEFILNNKELVERLLNTTNGLSLKPGNSNIISNIKPPFIFTSFQTPITNNFPMNGFYKILKEMYLILKYSENMSEVVKFKTNKVFYTCSKIGKILFKKKCIKYVKYIEEILEEDLSSHYKIDSTIEIINIPERNDVFFDSRKYDEIIEKSIFRFFKVLIKKYKKYLNNYYKQTEKKIKMPLILILEDSHNFDDISIEFIRYLRDSKEEKKLSGLGIIISYQDPIIPILKNSNDKFEKAVDLLSFNSYDIDDKNIPKIIIMENIIDKSELQDLIKLYYADYMQEVYKQSLDRIDPVMLEIIISKSFNGIPLLCLDIVDNLIHSRKFVQILSGEMIVTSELMDMVEMRDWSKFTVPTRLEKIVGSIIDALTPKEVIILKFASVIGNIFDISKLSELNPFYNNGISELILCIYSLEKKGLLEILYDLKPKQLICKFSIPFLREILYQRMLIEQKNDIHLNMARSLQIPSFKYMPHSQELKFLEMHLKTTEKTLNVQMEEEDGCADVLPNIQSTHELNLNNLKIICIKDICDRLKVIDLKLDTEEDSLPTNNFQCESALSNSKKNLNLQILRSGSLEKKSDKNITWEYRYVVVTSTKVSYYYYQQDYLENKKPLGTFSLKHLYFVELFNDFTIAGKKNLFEMQVSNWYKKDILKSQRRFLFSAKTREELYQWIITLNFLRVKAQYNDFSSQFGLLSLPLRHEKKEIKKKIKMKFNASGKISENNSANNNNNRASNFKTLILYNSVARRSVGSQKSIVTNGARDGSISVSRKTFNSLIRRISYFNMRDESTSNDENFDKLMRIKNNLSYVVYKSLLIFYGFIANVIFNLDSIGLSKDKVICIPEFLRSTVDESEGELSADNSITSGDDKVQVQAQAQDKNESEGQALATAADEEILISRGKAVFKATLKFEIEEELEDQITTANIKNNTKTKEYTAMTKDNDDDSERVPSVCFTLENEKNALLENTFADKKNKKNDLKSNLIPLAVPVEENKGNTNRASSGINTRYDLENDNWNVIANINANEPLIMTFENETVINKLKKLDVSVCEDEYLNANSRNYRNTNDNLSKSESFKINNEFGNNYQDSSQRIKNQLLPRYTDPKYDLLKNESSEDIYKKVHSSNLFKTFCKK